jgi:polyphosphate kinase
MVQSALQNREISWLRFNQRVLRQAERMDVPVFEKLRFIDIATRNLDEFFMIRVGGLLEQATYNPTQVDTKTLKTPEQQLHLIAQELKTWYPSVRARHEALVQVFKENQIEWVEAPNLNKSDAAMAESIFERELSAFVMAQIIDTKHPFPQLINHQVYVVLELERKRKRELAVVSFNPLMDPHWIPLSVRSPLKFLSSDDLLWLVSDRLFKEWKVLSKGLIRVTRNADLNLDESDDFEMVDYRRAMKNLIKKRARMTPVRLEHRYSLSSRAVLELRKLLNVRRTFVFHAHSPLRYTFIRPLEERVKSRKADWFFEPLKPNQRMIHRTSDSIIDQVQQSDLLLCTPFDSFNTYLQLLHEASIDPRVFSIQITLYRLAKESRVLQALIQAAESGKDVSVVLELKARFDESNNIEWSSKLEEAGVRVVYGVPLYKVHSKLTLIKLKQGRTLKTITHIGTGNYNETTARLYTDFHLISGHAGIGEEAGIVMNRLLTNTFDDGKHLKHLLMSPINMKSSLLHLIDQEINHHRLHQNGRIVFKFNALTDLDLIQALMRASQAGVKIQLLIRGISCLLPGVKDWSDNIKVISFVGRFLEHSRLYFFNHNDAPKIYISSADGMTRNMTKRVELAVEIIDSKLRTELSEMMEGYLRDDVNSWNLDSRGVYTASQPITHFNVHEHLLVPSTPPTPNKGVKRARLRWFFQR